MRVAMRKRVAKAVAAVAAMVLACGTAPSAMAADSDQMWYINDTGVRDAWDAGLTGKDIKTAVLDSPIVVDYPGFEGQDVTPRIAMAEGVDSCTSGVDGHWSVTLTRDDPVFHAGKTDGIVVNHGTEMAALIVGNGRGYDGNPGIQGVAPDVSLRTYAVHVSQAGTIGDSSAYQCLAQDQLEAVSTSASVRDAVDQGVRVLSMSYVDDPVDDEDIPLFIYALAHGVVMISGRDNVTTGGTDDMVGEPGENNYFPGVVTINAVDSQGAVAARSYTNDGNVAILSPGVNVPGHVFTSDRKLSEQGTGGTSMGAALLNGYVALVMQKWPKATGNQVLQSLVRNTKENDSGEAKLDEHHVRGFGTVDLGKLLKTDPTQYPDVNPILEQMVTRSEAHEETQGMYSDHSDWDRYATGTTDAFPTKIKVPKYASMAGDELKRQQDAWADVEQCQKDGGSDCMAKSATATAPTYDELASQVDALAADSVAGKLAAARKQQAAEASQSEGVSRSDVEAAQQSGNLEREADGQSPRHGGLFWIVAIALVAVVVCVVAVLVFMKRARKDRTRNS
ncbi:MAG: S8 family serine peptidase [Bifidobacterium sp.]|nr:S8 family serine peptidase [Bifidobacterium sp.]